LNQLVLVYSHIKADVFGNIKELKYIFDVHNIYQGMTNETRSIWNVYGQNYIGYIGLLKPIVT